MENLIQDIRIWNQAWLTYDVGLTKIKPKSLDQLIKELELKYNVITK